MNPINMSSHSRGLLLKIDSKKAVKIGIKARHIIAMEELDSFIEP
jgi:hypothetical protein